MIHGKKRQLLYLRNKVEFADLEIDELTRIKNEQALSNMWDSINSVSGQS
jgi:hypothetical protein